MYGSVELHTMAAIVKEALQVVLLNMSENTAIHDRHLRKQTGFVTRQPALCQKRTYFEQILRLSVALVVALVVVLVVAIRGLAW